jgi:flagellar hook protein FlgE
MLNRYGMTNTALWAGKPTNRSADTAGLSAHLDWAGRGLCLCLYLCLSTSAFADDGENPVIPSPCETDLAILGPGYFIAREPVENLLYVRRTGSFYLDAGNYLTAFDGMRVQGFADAALSQIGDLRIDGDGRPCTGGPAAWVCDLRIQSDGKLRVALSDGTVFTRGQILLQSFRSPALLQKLGDGYYSLESSASPMAQPVPPGTGGVGTLAANTLEWPRPELNLSQVRSSPCPATQGALYRTGGPTDLGIRGKGFFVVRDPNSNVLYATRAGAFFTDAAGFLISYSGLRVQGYTNANLREIGDIQLDQVGSTPTADPDVAVADYYINRYGKVSAVESN